MRKINESQSNKVYKEQERLFLNETKNIVSFLKQKGHRDITFSMDNVPDTEDWMEWINGDTDSPTESYVNLCISSSTRGISNSNEFNIGFVLDTLSGCCGIVELSDFEIVHDSMKALTPYMKVRLTSSFIDLITFKSQLDKKNLYIASVLIKGKSQMLFGEAFDESNSFEVIKEWVNLNSDNKIATYMTL